MLILKEEQVNLCHLNLIKEDKNVIGFRYLNRFFIPVESKGYYQLETAISDYKRWLLEKNLFCVILQQSEVYSIWCLAPGTAKKIRDYSFQTKQDNLGSTMVSSAIAV